MEKWHVFLIGIFVGVNLGVVIAAILQSIKHKDNFIRGKK